MNQFLATLRHRPAPLAGTFVALALAAVLVTVTASLLGTGITLKVPAQRLADAAVVVTANQNVSVTTGTGLETSTDVLPLPVYRRLPAALAPRLAAVPGAARAVPDISVPVALRLPGGGIATGTAAEPITGHGWDSAALTPFTLDGGHAPAGPNDMVIGAGLARSAGLRPGDSVRLAGQDLPPFTVTGLAATAAGNPAQDWTVFFSDAEATALYGHAGQADLIGVIASPGTSPAVLASRIRGAAGGGVTVRYGSSRGQAEDLAAANDKLNVIGLATTGGVDVVLIGMFVVAGTVALSVAQRWRNIALMRAIGATAGQVRRMMFLELALLGSVAGLVGFLPGVWLASWAVRGLAAHQLLPPSAHAWTSAWILLIAIGAGMVIAQISGFVAGRRASRMAPVAALQEASTERRWPHPVRIVFGLGALGGAVALCVVLLTLHFSAYDQLNLALALLLATLVAVALLGPLLVALAEALIRFPLRVFAGVAARLALADIRRRPRRMASAVVSVALGVAFVGAVYFIDGTQAHASDTQGRQRLIASEVVSAPGPGLSPAALAAAAGQPGVATAIGLTPTTVFVPFSGNETTAAEAVTPGSVGSVLDLGVVSGSLAHFGPGDIALSRLVAGKGAMNVTVGQTITSYLADGTPYRATVTAIFSRSLGFGDALIPSAASGGGHLGPRTLGEILIHTSGGASPAAVNSGLQGLAGRFPGLRVASSSIVNAQAELLTAQNSYANNLLLGLIAILAAVALVNTLIMATVERRDTIRLLQRIGTTTRQVVSATAWQTAVLSVLGVVLGAMAATASVLLVAKALTGTWTPYVTWRPVVVIIGSVVVLTAVATFGPTSWILAENEEQ